ncbi:MAG: NAD(P)/FAD-dependent oxidoreductase [Pseudomonadota bacterium]
MTIVEQNIALKDLERRIRQDLHKIAWPNVAWVKPRTAPDGAPMDNVLIIGAGQGGIALAFQLMRERVDRVRLLDKAPLGREGPWRNTARMITLRSPKETTGPDLDIPSLTFQSYYEARNGPDAWGALGKIPKGEWQDYLTWLRGVLGLNVESETRVTQITPHPTHVEVTAQTAAGERTYRARHVVLATGIDGTGRWWMPEFLTDLPPGLAAHAADVIDFERLAGKVVAVLGAGASAFDNAATALEAGAREVHIFVRRKDLQRVQPYKQVSYTGFLRHMADLPDAMRWKMLTYLLDLREAFPAETWKRVTKHDNVTIHTGRGWTGAAPTEDGRLRLETSQGDFVADFAIAGTGLDMDMSARPELSGIAARIARWADRYTPPAGMENPRLARYPYLGGGFELEAKSGDADEAAALSRVKVFTFGATMSFGPSGSSINAMKFSAPRLVSGITRAIFSEDAEKHLDDLKAYNTEEF